MGYRSLVAPKKRLFPGQLPRSGATNGSIECSLVWFSNGFGIRFWHADSHTRGERRVAPGQQQSKGATPVLSAGHVARPPQEQRERDRQSTSRTRFSTTDVEGRVRGAGVPSSEGTRQGERQDADNSARPPRRSSRRIDGRGQSQCHSLKLELI